MRDIYERLMSKPIVQIIVVIVWCLINLWVFLGIMGLWGD